MGKGCDDFSKFTANKLVEFQNRENIEGAENCCFLTISYFQNEALLNTKVGGLTEYLRPITKSSVN